MIVAHRQQICLVVENPRGGDINYEDPIPMPPRWGSDSERPLWEYIATIMTPRWGSSCIGLGLGAFCINTNVKNPRGMI